MTRIAIIGAGPSGMAQMRAFQSDASNGHAIPEVVCFEKCSDWGGLWNYTWRTGLDDHGEPVHCSMYRYLWTNGPKEGLEFADYTFDEHFGKGIGSYPPRAVLWDYMKGRVEKANVRPWVRFSTPVRHVAFDEKTGLFTVTAHDLEADRIYTETFDYVVVAAGHFSTPHAPHFEGMEGFNGRVLHAHDFRDAVEFQGKDVLLVGSSYSAEDIGSQCWKYGARSVTSCYRSKPMGFKWPANWEEKPLLTRLENRTVHFADGSSKEVDAIILCTGYIHHLPFLPDALRLKTRNRMWPLGLYKGVVWEANPKLFYLGMQDQWFTFNMFDAQAWFVRDVIQGRITLPTQDEMTADSLHMRTLEEALASDADSIRFQGEYVKDLIARTNYPSFDIDGVVDIFLEWKRHKKENIMTFRDHAYRSVMTGQMSPLHHTPWKDALDDSLEAYLSDTPLECVANDSRFHPDEDFTPLVRRAISGRI